MFPCEFCKMFKKTFFTEHFQENYFRIYKQIE